MAEETPLVPDITQQVSEEIAEPSKEVVPSDPLSSNGPVPESLVAKDPIPAAIEAETSAGPSKQAETLSETPVISEHPPTPMLDNSMAVDEPPPPPQTIVNDDDERPLNVTDALSYLDQVKVQYQQRPDVYNNFLEIMKQFKSQRIDTPGVIQRVSELFNGHWALIEGFNTFLPAGYRIEITAAPNASQKSSFITVTTPTGTHIQAEGGRDTLVWMTDRGETLLSVPTTQYERQMADSLYIPPENMSDSRVFMTEGDAIEPAVQYVQKIKQRCDPETYKQFLDILSQYHRKTNSIDEEAVSKQIARLFKDDPDLREEFRIFMPDGATFHDDGGYVLEDARPHREKRKLDQAASSSQQKRRRKGDKDESSSKHKRSKNFETSSSRHTTGDKRSSQHYQPIASSSRGSGQSDGSQFFYNVQRALENREVYNEFLKLVNLFTQGFIDTLRLVTESHNYLGDSDLMRQWKEILGWDERKDRELQYMGQQLHTQNQGWSRPTLTELGEKVSSVDLTTQYGSYRKVSEAEANVTCSGRDPMCQSVLNDEWACHATFAADDSGFVTHRKNIYEEALHRSEEERHEYDYHIEAISRTIQTLEPIHNKIAMLPEPERATFKLKPNLGGAAKAIHHRVVKKIYGREAGQDVIQAMQDMPTVAIPLVLKRLKVKEEEWRRAQREWSKVWREVDARNYVKSLDHQSITFRTADKKATSAKALLTEIEVVRDELRAKRAGLVDPLFARRRAKHHLEYDLEDIGVLQDALKLTFSFLDRTQGQINQLERKRVESFLLSFVPLFMGLDAPGFSAAFATDEGDLDLSSVDDGTTSKGKGRRGKASGGGDLRKKLLKSEQAKSTHRKTRGQEGSTPLPTTTVNDAEGSDMGRTVFFANTHYYILIRLLETLYSRLALFKSLGQEKANKPDLGEAPSLGLTEGDIAGLSGIKPEHYYHHLLEACEQLFENEIEMSAFEDQMRLLFGIKHAYKIFTIDKVIGSFIKQVQIIIGDSKSQDLLDNLKRDRATGVMGTQDMLSSQQNAEKLLGPDENLFRINLLYSTKVLTVQLLGNDDSDFDEEVTTGRWQNYVESFVTSHPTEGISPALRKPFLRRNLSTSQLPDVIAHDDLQIKVCVQTYRMFYVPNTEDFCVNIRPAVAENAENLRRRTKLRETWLQNAKEPRTVSAIERPADVPLASAVAAVQTS